MERHRSGEVSRPGLAVIDPCVNLFLEAARMCYVPILFLGEAMAISTAIEWTDATWNPVTGCTKISAGCDNVNSRYTNGSVPQHIWLGTSIEDGSKKSRARHIQTTNASVRFLSIEPLLGPIGKIDLEGIHWVIVGGESGPRARPMLVEWARDVRDQCKAAKVPFFFKQWGGLRPKSGGRLLDGREWNEWPIPQTTNRRTVGGSKDGSAKTDHLGAGASYAGEA